MTPAKIEDLEKFDAAEYLETVDDIRIFLKDTFECGNPQDIAAALGAVARSKGMTALANETGLSREGLYKALSPKGDPKLSTLYQVLDALGLRLSIEKRQAVA